MLGILVFINYSLKCPICLKMFLINTNEGKLLVSNRSVTSLSPKLKNSKYSSAQLHECDEPYTLQSKLWYTEWKKHPSCILSEFYLNEVYLYQCVSYSYFQASKKNCNNKNSTFSKMYPTTKQ